MGAGSIGFGFLAGVFSVLSPCVLPLLPLVIGGAAAAHRWGVAALAGGLVLSFVTVGLFVATVGFALGLTGAVVRDASAVLLAAMGVLLLSGALQQRLAVAASGLGDAGNRLMARAAPGGGGAGGQLGGQLGGQFAIGAILGAVWSPCVGPTLGAASLLAAQGKDLGSVAAVMTAFGLGAALPLLLVGSLSREALKRWRGRMLGVGSAGKYLLGSVALVLALFILSGADRAVETLLVNASPDWLTDLTTRY